MSTDKRELVNSTFLMNRFKRLTKQRLYYLRKTKQVKFIKVQTKEGKKFLYELGSVEEKLKEIDK